MKDRLRDHPMFADTSLRCKYCGESYEEDSPPALSLQGIAQKNANGSL